MLEEIKLYLDEDVQTRLAEALRKRGFDVVTAQEVSRKSFSDEDQLNFASSQNRAILTYNARDYAKLNGRYITEGREHKGIIISGQLPIGEMLRRITKLMLNLFANDMRNQLEYLSDWK
ncbi:MAG: DUF5615 family PIN-like protein [bacterium]